MAQIANIVLNDAQATPVAHTFEPSRTSADFAAWEDRSSAYYIGYNKVTMTLKRPTGPSNQANRNIRAMVKIETPKLENVSNSTISGIAPAPTVSYRPAVMIEFVLPERCSLQDRKDLRKYADFLLAHASVIDLVELYSIAY